MWVWFFLRVFEFRQGDFAIDQELEFVEAKLGRVHVELMVAV